MLSPWISPRTVPTPFQAKTGLASGAHAMQTFPNVYSVAATRLAAGGNGKRSDLRDVGPEAEIAFSWDMEKWLN